jgi:hydroxymethylbilane synthase
VPLGGYAELRQGEVWLRGFVATPDGKQIVEGELAGAPGDADALGLALAAELRRRGADAILAALAGCAA